MEEIVSSQLRFWLLLIFEIPSLPCCLVLLYYLCFDRTIRKQVHYHSFIPILVNVLLVELVDIPNYLTHLRLETTWPANPANCYAWWYVAFGCNYMIGIGMAWASLERHILVFHQRWLNTTKKRLFVHYIPLATVVLYGHLFYAVCIFVAPCEAEFDYSSLWCLTPCYYQFPTLSRYDAIMHGLLPGVFVLIINLLLLMRVIRQKRRLRQAVDWHKYKRMIIQISSCAVLFVLGQQGPWVLIFFQTTGIPLTDTGQFVVFGLFVGYFIPLLMPFICLASSNDIWKKMTARWRPGQRVSRITPNTFRRDG